jgi:hypothetical protein
MTFDLQDFFRVTDSMRADKFKAFFTNDASWTFGNMPIIAGADAIAQTAQFFFNGLHSIKHEISASVEVGNKIFFEGYVSYDLKHKDKLITLPFACSIQLTENRISSYRTYIDITPLGL